MAVVLVDNRADILDAATDQVKAAGARDVMTRAMDVSDRGAWAELDAKVEAQLGGADILMCNAGVMALPELQLVNGVEAQFAINHLGHFLFTNNLLEAVKKAQP